MQFKNKNNINKRKLKKNFYLKFQVSIKKKKNQQINEIIVK